LGSSQGDAVRHDARGFTLIELMIVVVIIGILASIVVPKFANGKERAVVASMKSDLRNLVSAQEAYYSNGLTYYNGAVPSAAMPYDPSQGVTVTLSTVSNTGWAAQATYVSTTKTCSIFVGTGTPIAPATVDGQVACTP
jgi:prepilin-type N-terminal cleavage/methylation domain-containing protein